MFPETATLAIMQLSSRSGSVLPGAVARVGTRVRAIGVNAEIGPRGERERRERREEKRRERREEREQIEGEVRERSREKQRTERQAKR